MSKKVLALALATVFSVGTAQAIPIDDFDGGAQSVSSPISDTIAYGGAIGGFRTVSISSIGPLGATAAIIAPPGIYSHSADALTSATSILSWNAGSADLVDGLINNFFSFDILSIDQGSIDLTLTVDGVSQTLAGLGTGNQTVAFADFAAVDFTSVNLISLTIAGDEASDLTLDSLFTSGEQAPSTVPEPTSLALLVAGLAAFGFGRRKVK